MSNEKLIAIQHKEAFMPSKLELYVSDDKIQKCEYCKHLKQYVSFKGMIQLSLCIGVNFY